MKNIEIEIKVQVEKNVFENFKSYLSKNAEFIKSSEQSDEYFTPSHRNFVEPAFPFEWLSIRERNNHAILNYKHWYPENEEKSTHCDEFEVELSDAENMRKIFNSLNIETMVKVVKKREIYNHKGEFEICLDEVDELGYFIEIEVKKEFGSIETANKKLIDFATEMGIDVSKRNYRGYPFLLMEKHGLI
jgi:adenylate cyclase, class 2